MSLYGILAFYDRSKPLDAVFARRETLLAEAMLGSLPTLFRGLATLEKHGYITREQGRRLSRAEYGQYSISRIWLTRKALVMLGLPVPAVLDGAGQGRVDDDAMAWGELPTVRLDGESQELTEAQVFEELDLVDFRPVYPQPRSISVIDRIQDSERSTGLQLLTGEQPLSVREKTERPDGVGESSGKSDRKSRLPAELVPLMELGVSKTRICLLMRIARQAGNAGKLGDAVKLVWGRICSKRGKEVFAYLAAVVRQQRDFARTLMIQAPDPATVTASEGQRLGDKLRDLLSRCGGMEVIGRAGRMLGVLRASGESGYIEGYDETGVRRTMPANVRFAKAVEEGSLLLRPARVWA
ncbi:replication protein [Zoogloea oleivorans]|uniref:Replication protein n=1 Tax=Zoogloea oleivorans TaxID=1552750 RepID=A0A6C2CCQ8_9RHOO|nr:replication protein [Zoogloea oleivorans]TYC51382.1 replication protein [Zoogloea oleivorans]